MLTLKRAKADRLKLVDGWGVDGSEHKLKLPEQKLKGITNQTLKR
jgi:hypothetical protein